MTSAYETASLAAALRQAGCAEWLPAFRPPSLHNHFAPVVCVIVADRHPPQNVAAVAADIHTSGKGTQKRKQYIAVCHCDEPCRDNDAVYVSKGHDLAAAAVPMVRHLAEHHGRRPPPATPQAKNRNRTG